MICEAMVAVAFSVLVYKTIVRRQGSTLAYLVGFGLVIPFWVFFPSMVVDWMGVRNKLYRFCMAAVTPTLCVFRTTEGKMLSSRWRNSAFLCNKNSCCISIVLLNKRLAPFNDANSYVRVFTGTHHEVSTIFYGLLWIPHGG